MKAAGYNSSLPIEASDALLDITVVEPTPQGRDLLVAVKAVSVNPVDTKLRKNSAMAPGETKILGFDAVGEVVATGPQANLFKPGDAVWYAGVINRPGSNAELQLVDERIVGRKPASLSDAQAAALPLTAITAWELLFDRLGVARSQARTDQRLLVVGAGGGVGSIMVQLARQLTGLTVIGTASRDETQAWVSELGAHQVIDHSQPLSQELKRIGVDNVTHVASLTHSEQHFAEIIESLAPQGKLGLIDDLGNADINALKTKSLSLHWEFMFTRAVYATHDMIAQHALLNELASLVEQGVVRTTVGEHFGTINAANLKRAHAYIESGTAKGKVVLEGFN